ncbi:MAG: hypothetical protein QM756_24895 [Polyangiaceae bacterium]
MQLNFRPNVDLISSTRRFVNELLDSMLADPDASSRVALTIHELLENTLKYSTDGEARLDVSLQQNEGSYVVEVRASNRATPEQLQELKQRIDELREVSDPMGLYVSMMVDSARRDGSGLGLVRIRVEGGNGARLRDRRRSNHHQVFDSCGVTVMQNLNMQSVVFTGFQLTPRLEDTRVVVAFAGNGDMSAVEALGRFLKGLHPEATNLGVKEVAFDFRDLYFMNSSCFKAFVTWIDVVSRASVPPYTIRFLTNPRLHWQRRSLEALRCLAPNVVRVEALAV